MNNHQYYWIVRCRNDYEKDSASLKKLFHNILTKKHNMMGRGIKKFCVSFHPPLDAPVPSPTYINKQKLINFDGKNDNKNVLLQKCNSNLRFTPIKYLKLLQKCNSYTKNDYAVLLHFLPINIYITN